MTTTNKIFLIGAGPGDPDLLTRKAWSLLQNADAVFYDDLVGDGILQELPETQERFFVGKRSHDGVDQAIRLQETVNGIMAKIQEGKSVVRLKGGDPMIFGRTAQEVEALRELGVNCEIIPGISAGLAAASLYKIPITARFVSDGALIVTGHTADGRIPSLDAVSSWLRGGNTAIFYMVRMRWPQVCQDLLDQNVSASTPACAVSHVSLKTQEIYQGNMSGLEKGIESLQAPIVIIIGESVKQL